MKKFYLLPTILLGALAFSFTGLQAQVLEGSTNTVKLDFGYPELRFINEAISFLDENDNNIIDAGEGSIIRLTIENQSRFVAKDVIVTLQDLNNLEGLEIPEEVEVGDIEPFTKANVQIGVAATNEVETGTANFIFYAKERAEAGRVSVVYTVATVVDPNSGDGKK